MVSLVASPMPSHRMSRGIMDKGGIMRSKDSGAARSSSRMANRLTRPAAMIPSMQLSAEPSRTRDSDAIMCLLSAPEAHRLMNVLNTEAGGGSR